MGDLCVATQIIPYIEYKIPTNKFIETLKCFNKTKN